MPLMFCLPAAISLSDPELFLYEAKIENFEPHADLEFIRPF